MSQPQNTQKLCLLCMIELLTVTVNLQIIVLEV